MGAVRLCHSLCRCAMDFGKREGYIVVVRGRADGRNRALGPKVKAKLEVDDDQNGPLRRLERLEALALGIEGKIALCRALDVVPAKGAIGQINYERLCRRGEEQRSGSKSGASAAGDPS